MTTIHKLDYESPIGVIEIIGSLVVFIISNVNILTMSSLSETVCKWMTIPIILSIIHYKKANRA